MIYGVLMPVIGCTFVCVIACIVAWESDKMNDVNSHFDDVPTIDPETLPIVQKLKNDVDGLRQNWYKACEMVKRQRTELKRVTAERDSYKIFFEDITKCGDCNDCGKSKTCEFVPKVGQTTRYNCPLWAGR